MLQIPARYGFACVIAGLLLCACSDTINRDLLRQAVGAENSGQFTQAQDLYAQAFLARADIRDIPDRNLAAKTSVQSYTADIGSYLAHVRKTGLAADSVGRAALDGMFRCAPKFEQLTFAPKPSAVPLDTSSGLDYWQKSFLPEFMQVDSAHFALMRSALSDSVSIIEIKARPNYSYEGAVTKSSGASAVRFSLYAEGAVYVPLTPGSYTIIARAKAQFASGGTYTSPYSVIELVVPARSSLVSLTLTTLMERAPKR